MWSLRQMVICLPFCLSEIRLSVRYSAEKLAEEKNPADKNNS